MKILFLLHKGNRLRNFDSLIRRLAESGHTVLLGFRGKVKELAQSAEEEIDALPESLKHPRIHVVICGRWRADGWTPYATALRAMRDAVRYFHPRYADSNFLRNRAFKRLKFPAGLWLLSLYRSRPLRILGFVVGGILALIEKLIPSDRAIEADIRAHAPDVMLVTPLIQFGTDYQVDYIKAAHKLGIPVAFLPFSWDNLTNKGLMRIVPDRVFVWNETQQREAVRMHSIPRNKAVICGAWRFDDFFAMGPRLERSEFCRKVGLDPSRQFTVYLCSSESTSSNESLYIRKWLKALRDSPEESVRQCGVLIRPYPGNWWTPEDFAGFSNVSIMPHRLYGETLAASWGDQELYDCLYHSAAVVGLNTSAMIEAAILGKPVHTIIVDEFRGGQAGTLHFHYFLTVNGGLPRLARNLEEHTKQLGQSLACSKDRDPKSERFARAFVRPFGLEKEVAPILVSEIEKLSYIRKKPLRHVPAREFLGRCALAMLNRFAPLFLNKGHRDKLLHSLAESASGTLETIPSGPAR